LFEDVFLSYNIGLFEYNIGLFEYNIGLFEYNIGLFWQGWKWASTMPVQVLVC